MNAKEATKLYVFIGLIILMFLSGLLMTGLMIVGANALGEVMLYASIVISLVFVAAAGFFSSESKQSH
jgi:purine-cytosine permease-like protein